MLFPYKYRGIFIIIIFMLFIFIDDAFCQQPHKIRGAVIDRETGKPIPTVHVYISQSTVGTTTKFDGTFEFSTSLEGVHTLVFSFVGYKTESRKINLYSDKNPYIEIKMIPAPIELEALEVTASNKEWQENFNIFRKNFIGETGAALYTDIENPWVLSFERDSDENLIAYASHPLEIYNYALGYQIKVDLVEFKWPKSGELGYYLFYASYSDIEPGNRRQQRRWERNRRNAYMGSFEHFLKSLYVNDLKGNDFDVVIPNTYDLIEIQPMDSLSIAAFRANAHAQGLNPDDVKAYRLRHPVDVLYGKRWFNKNRTRSRIVPIARSGIFILTDQARLVNPISVRLDGVWSGHRLANQLPANYILEE